MPPLIDRWVVVHSDGWVHTGLVWELLERGFPPEDPRFAFAGQEALFKLYLIREVPVPDESLDDDPCVELMRQLLPAMRTTLFDPS